jgi:hypothetical protein
LVYSVKGGVTSKVLQCCCYSKDNEHQTGVYEEIFVGLFFKTHLTVDIIFQEYKLQLSWNIALFFAYLHIFCHLRKWKTEHNTIFGLYISKFGVCVMTCFVWLTDATFKRERPRGKCYN